MPLRSAPAEAMLFVPTEGGVICVQTVTIDLAGRDTADIEAWLASVTTQPLDDIPLARNHDDIAEIVGDKSTAIFRIEDDPFVLAVWQSIDLTATVYTLWRRTLHSIEVLLLNGVPSLPPLLRALLTTQEIESLRSTRCATLGRIIVREHDDSLAGVLGFIAYMPVWCELHAVK